ncbi:uncharacterized protein LOC143291416 [Babylonia areolata]|uniref:uncharacterized protein LOC143291416 n=1 Tax=Babylonia areolata TaxID=304850 RepID=UPI003FD4E06C
MMMTDTPDSRKMDAGRVEGVVEEEEAGSSSSLSSRGHLPLWKRVLVCAGMLALESYITYEEIYLTTTLQRLHVPYVLLSLPGALSGGAGIFVVPILGWAMDRHRGNKRRFAIGTLSVLSAGMVVLIYSGSVSLYHPDPTAACPTSDPISNHTVTALNQSTGDVMTMMTSSNQSVAEGGGGGGGVGEAGSVLTVTGALAIAGFTMGDHGYDTSTLTVRAYILSISAPRHHDSLLLTTTMMGAIGGCVTSLVGFLDLSVLFPQVTGQNLDRGDAQFLVQSVVFVLTLVVFFTCAFWASHKLFENTTTNKTSLLLRPLKENHNSYSCLEEEEERGGEGGRGREEEEEEFFSTRKSEMKHLVANGSRTARKYHDSQGGCSGPAEARTGNGNVPHVPLHDRTCGQGSNSNAAKAEPTKMTKRATTGFFGRRMKSRIALMMMVFLVIIAMSSYFFYITNYVAEIIYKGDPHAPSGSDAYQQYVFGTRMASLSMLTFYVTFVIFNFFHEKILDKIGMKAELIITSVMVTVLTLIVVVTESMVMVFITMLPLAAYRSCCYTVPFILANKYAQEEHQELLGQQVDSQTPSDGSGGGGGGGKAEEKGAAGTVGTGGGGGREGDAPQAGSGSALASVTVMIPLTYCLVCIAAGPLIALTGNTGLPIHVSVGAYGLGTLSAFFVDFN